MTITIATFCGSAFLLEAEAQHMYNKSTVVQVIVLLKYKTLFF